MLAVKATRISILVLVGTGIVAAVVMGYLSSLDRARDRDCQGNLDLLGYALASFAGDNNGHYPKTLDELAPKYLGRLPLCGEHAYGYSASSELSNFTLVCRGYHTDDPERQFSRTRSYYHRERS